MAQVEKTACSGSRHYHGIDAMSMTKDKVVSEDIRDKGNDEEKAFVAEKVETDLSNQIIWISYPYSLLQALLLHGFVDV